MDMNMNDYASHILAVGLTAMPCAGKGDCAEVLTSLAVRDMQPFYHVLTPRFSASARRILDTAKTAVDRDALQRCVQIMEQVGVDEGRGPGELSRMLKTEILTAAAFIEKPILVILDGARWPTDEAMIRSFPHNFIIGIEADQKVRWERAIKRAENAGDAEKAWERFQAEDTAINERHIPTIMSGADIIINNNSNAEGAHARYHRMVEHHWFAEIRPRLVSMLSPHHKKNP